VMRGDKRIGPQHRISPWMPSEPLTYYKCALACVLLRRAQLAEWNSQSSPANKWPDTDVHPCARDTVDVPRANGY
jgi:hypothetical protein